MFFGFGYLFIIATTSFHRTFRLEGQFYTTIENSLKMSVMSTEFYKTMNFLANFFFFFFNYFCKILSFCIAHMHYNTAYKQRYNNI